MPVKEGIIFCYFESATHAEILFVLFLQVQEEDEGSKTDEKEAESKDVGNRAATASFNLSFAEVLPNNQRRIGRRYNFGPRSTHVFVLDRILFLFHPEAPALARADIHGLQELSLTVHTLELDEGIACFSWIVLLVVVAFLEDLIGCVLKLFGLRLDFGLGLLCPIILIKLSEIFIKFLLSYQELAHLLHVCEVAKIGEPETDIPDIILVLINFFVVRTLILLGFVGVDVLAPGVVDAR